MRWLALVVVLGCGAEKKASAPAEQVATGGGGAAPETRSSDPQEGGEATGKGQPAAAVGAAPAGLAQGGDLTDDNKAVIEGAMAKFKACYKTGLKKNAMLKGQVRATFTIDATGAVTQANATGLADDVDACVTGVMKTLKFKRAGEATYTFNFE